jgi:hypothetical protein
MGRAEWFAAWTKARFLASGRSGEVAVSSSELPAVVFAVDVMIAHRFEGFSPEARDRRSDARVKVTDRLMHARAREHFGALVDAGVVGHHGRSLEALKAANALFATRLEGPFGPDMIEAFAAVCAAQKALPRSARLGVDSREAWRAGGSIVRRSVRAARRLVSVYDRDRNATAALLTSARACFGKVFEAEIEAPKVTGDGLVVRAGVEASARARDLALGIAFAAVRDVRASSPRPFPSEFWSEVVAKVAERVLESASGGSDACPGTSEPGGGSSSRPGGGAWFRRPPRSLPSWRSPRVSSPEVRA